MLRLGIGAATHSSVSQGSSYCQSLVNVCNSFYGWSQCGCRKSGLMPEAMLIDMDWMQSPQHWGAGGSVGSKGPVPFHSDHDKAFLRLLAKMQAKTTHPRLWDWLLGIWLCSSDYMDNRKCLFFFEREVIGEQIWEVIAVRVHVVKFPNNQQLIFNFRHVDGNKSIHYLLKYVILCFAFASL